MLQHQRLGIHADQRTAGDRGGEPWAEPSWTTSELQHPVRGPERHAAHDPFGRLDNAAEGMEQVRRGGGRVRSPTTEPEPAADTGRPSAQSRPPSDSRWASQATGSETTSMSVATTVTYGSTLGREKLLRIH